MKKLSLIIFFLLTLQNLSYADTISEYEEAGLKLGKSILEVMTFEKIIESVVERSKDERYLTVEHVPDTSVYNYASTKTQISPRFGLAYQVGEEAVMHFSYGHFFQMPPFYSLYQNYRFFIPVQDYQTVLGNPNLNAEKTVQYEFGYWEQVTQQFDAEITIYYRDIYDLLSTEVLTTYNNIKFGHFINKDYGNAKGMEFYFHPLQSYILGGYWLDLFG